MGKAVGQLWQRHTALLRRVMLHFLPTITSSTFLQEIFAEGKKILSPGTKWFSVWETSQLNAAPRMYLTLKIPSFKQRSSPGQGSSFLPPGWLCGSLLCLFSQKTFIELLPHTRHMTGERYSTPADMKSSGERWTTKWMVEAFCDGSQGLEGQRRWRLNWL